MLQSLLGRVHVAALPMRTTFRGITVREVALIEGPEGWGEFSPFTEYDDGEALLWLMSACEAAFEKRNVPLRNSIRVNATLPAVNSEEEIEKILSLYPGVEVVKVKVGTSLQSDLERIKKVQAIAPHLRIRLDANGLWSVAEAEEFIAAFSEVIPIQLVEYIEQPCATLVELRELKSKLKVPVKIMADELIRKTQDPFSLDLAGAVDVIMLKVSPLGGIQRSLKIAKHFGLPVVVSSALESAIGISYGLQLAAEIPDLSYDCGLATGALFTRDVAELPIRSGAIALESVTPNAQSLNELSASADRQIWWRNRIERVWQLGMEKVSVERGWQK